MQLTCPHCSHLLAIDESNFDTELACPACSGLIDLRNLERRKPAPAPTQHAQSRDSRCFSSSRRPKKGARWIKFLILLLFLGTGAFFFATHYYKETPAQLLRRITNAIESFVRPPLKPLDPAPTPFPAPTPAASPSPTPAPATSIPSPTATLAPTPPPDPIAWMLPQKKLWPKNVTLLEETSFLILIDGKLIGSTRVPAGSRASLVQIDGDTLILAHGNGTAKIPINATDLRQQASNAMDWAKDKPSPEPALSARNTPIIEPFVSVEKATKTVDEIVLGDDRSEKKHNLKSELSESYKGGLDQPARRLLPGGTNPWEGGWIEWTMKVDPKEQNYLTVKLWGSDCGEESGRLILYANGLQVGYRHETDHDVLNQTDNDPMAPGRFVYVTVPLPPSLTKGKETLDLKINAIGRMWPYGTTFDIYQKNLTQSSRGIYRAYTHNEPRFAPATPELQGKTPSSRKRATDSDEVIDRSKEVVRERLSKILSDENLDSSDEKKRNSRLTLLSEAYNTRWTPAYRDRRTLQQIVRDGDALAEAYAASKENVEKDWVGASPLGIAVMQTWPDIGRFLDDKITITGSETTRRRAWSRTLLESVNYWRTHRRAYTNQSMFVDAGIYFANRGLQLIDPESALPEQRALDFLYEATGVKPWLGSDLPAGGSEKPYGANYYLITQKGLSRELGYVGTYGETIIPLTAEIVALSGDQKILEQLRKMQKARQIFRYPSLDADGYRCMKLVSEIDDRTAHYPVSGSAYNGPYVRELWGMETAALFPEDPDIIGAAQQNVADGQYFPYIQSRLGDPQTKEMMRNVDHWEKVRKLPKTGRPLPMTPGQPDFVFSDEENAVLAIKHGETNLFINFYYRAHHGINRVARILEIGPTITRIVTARPEVEIIGSGETYERSNRIDWERSGGHPPPGQNIDQAWAGEKLPIAKRPNDAAAPEYGRFGPFVGKAAFYSLRYGDYLIGLNTTPDHTYPLEVPSAYRKAKDLVSGKEVSLVGSVKVPPLSTSVLYLGKYSEPNR